MADNLSDTLIWSPSKKFFFYFVFLYVFLYVFPFPITLLVSIIQRFLSWFNELSGWAFLQTVNDAIDTFFGWWDKLWYWLIPAIAKNILHLKSPVTIFPNGSGDTTYNWLATLVSLVLSLAGACIWSFASKRKTNYTRLYQFLLLILRYYLAYMLLLYGFVKVIQNQFPFPGLTRLLQPYGESSPMGLAWTFMGHSQAYNLFTGSCEILGGLLLLFRRTKVFGALFSMTVCFNIFVMNMCFDIPVKLFSFHLLLFSTYIAADSFKRLVAFFFQNQSTIPYEMPYYFAGSKWQKQLTGLKWLIILYLFCTNLADGKKRYYESGIGRPKPPLYGIYNAEYKIVNNDTMALVYRDTTSWKQLTIAQTGTARMKLLNDSARRYFFKVDSVKKTIVFYPQTDTTLKYNFSYSLVKDILTMSGFMKNDSVVMQFRRYDETKFLLNSRGFHWINEEPFNR